MKYRADSEISATVDVGGEEYTSSRSGSRADASRERSSNQKEKKDGYGRVIQILKEYGRLKLNR